MLKLQPKVIRKIKMQVCYVEGSKQQSTIIEYTKVTNMDMCRDTVHNIDYVVCTTARVKRQQHITIQYYHDS